MDRSKVSKAAAGLMWENRYRQWKQGRAGSRWFTPEIKFLDPDVVSSIEKFDIQAHEVLDIGTGWGWQAIELAKLGCQVTAIDASASAIAFSEKNAETENVHVNFIQGDINFFDFNGQFDLLLDRGCFTTLNESYHQDFSNNVLRWIKPSGWFLLKVNSRMGIPYIETCFGDSFIVHTAEPSIFQGGAPGTFTSLYFALQRKE